MEANCAIYTAETCPEYKLPIINVRKENTVSHIIKHSAKHDNNSNQ